MDVNPPGISLTKTDDSDVQVDISVVGANGRAGVRTIDALGYE